MTAAARSAGGRAGAGDHDRLSALRAELEPVRRALIEDASAGADQLAAATTGEAVAVIEQAGREAADEVARAEHRSEQSARASVDQLLARARSEAYRDLLEAKEAIRWQLVETVHRAALGLRRDPRYPVLLDELERQARHQLGPGAAVERDPDPAGGIVACAGERRVDYTLVAMADRALDALADEVSQLWA